MMQCIDKELMYLLLQKDRAILYNGVIYFTIAFFPGRCTGNVVIRSWYKSELSKCTCRISNKLRNSLRHKHGSSEIYWSCTTNWATKSFWLFAFKDTKWLSYKLLHNPSNCQDRGKTTIGWSYSDFPQVHLIKWWQYTVNYPVISQL